LAEETPFWANDSYQTQINALVANQMPATVQKGDRNQSTGPGAPPARVQTEYVSLLFEGRRPDSSPVKEPDFFHDLNLDLIVKSITAGRDDYHLESYFYSPVADVDTVVYRHEIMRDLERRSLFEALKSFSAQVRSMNNHLITAEKLYYRYEKERWVVDAAILYGSAVEKLHAALREAQPKSRGFASFGRYLDRYIASENFVSLMRDAQKLVTNLSAIRYSLLIQGNSITVRPYRDEADYAAVIEKVFARFRRGAVKNYQVKLPAESGLNHVEAQALDLVALLNPEVFAALDAFYSTRRDFADATLIEFEREIQFYLAYVEYMGKFERAGLKFCHPEVSDQEKDVRVQAGFDLALAEKLIRENAPVVCNDFALCGAERIFVVTGPNQGGKTTFARTFGQLHYLASLGCPVAGASAKAYLFDRLFTHFEREEDIATLNGKLQDDLIRVHRILSEATSRSVVIINEIFSSTSLQDAVILGREIISRISDLDLLAVCVTFLDELASLNEKTVSIVATIVPENPAARTFRLIRKPADGLSYALAIAEKYRLTYPRLKERLHHESPPAAS
jgi:DNA mismatch repair protein MutS